MKNLNLERPELTQDDLNTIIEFCSHPDNIEQNLSAKIDFEIGSVSKAKKAIILQDNKFLGYIQKNKNDLFYLDKSGQMNFILNNKSYERINNFVAQMFKSIFTKDVKYKHQEESTKERMKLIFE